MPRNLPWLSGPAASKKRASEARHLSTIERGRHSTPDNLVDTDLNTTGVVTPERRKAIKPARTPSTSPAPAPPDVEFMKEGFDADDMWMMVEDEFFATAQKFTQHIHRAEYDRLRKLARSRGDRTLRAMERATDGKTEQSTSLKMRMEADARAKKIKDDLEKVVGEESDDEDAYMLDANLAGLMTGSQSLGHDLRGIVKAQSNTRAAAGFDRSPRKPHSTRTLDRERTSGQDKHTVDGSPSKKESDCVTRYDVETASDSDDLDTVQIPNKSSNKDSSPLLGKLKSRRTSTFTGTSTTGEKDDVDAKSRRTLKHTAKYLTTSVRPAKSVTTGEDRSNRDDLFSSSEESDMLSEKKKNPQGGLYLARRRAKRDQEERDQEIGNAKPLTSVISVPMWL